MPSLLQQFPAAYLINLPERTDRLRSAAYELEQAGMPLGPNGVQVHPARKFADRGTFPTAGVRGCFYSHLECLHDAKCRGEPNVMLFEDDISFASSVSTLAPSILAQLDTLPWDFCYLGHESTGEIGRADSKTTEIRLTPYPGGIFTAHWVMINGRIISRLIAHLERVASGTEGDQEYGPMPVDGAYNIFRRNNSDVRTLIATPKLGWQRPSRSDITPRYFDRWRPLQFAASSARYLKYVASRQRS